MNKRDFLSAAVLAAATLPISALARIAKADHALSGPALLTLTGAIGHGNRGALDPALDQLMKKQGLQFDRAHAFDFSALTALPAMTIRPTLEYDGKSHALSGPLLSDVIKATGAAVHQINHLLLRAIDGYAVSIAYAEALQYGFIVATHLDGHPIPLGGLGPLWAVYDADRFPDMASKPLTARFALCPWGLYHIEVQV